MTTRSLTYRIAYGTGGVLVRAAATCVALLSSVAVGFTLKLIWNLFWFGWRLVP